MRHLFTYGPVTPSDSDHVPQQEVDGRSIPAHWQVMTLADIAKIERGKFTHRPRNDPAFYGGRIPFIQTGDITKAALQDGRIRTYSQTLNEKGLAVSRVFPRQTIAITIAANIGYSAILEFDSAFPDSIIAITPHAECSVEFLNYYLTTQQPEMDRLAPRGTQKNINIEFLKPWPVPLPPLEEQKQISDVLAAVDARIAAESRRGQSLNTLVHSLSAELLTGRRLIAEASR
jgi:type I restriction enzyme S subunit